MNKTKIIFMILFLPHFVMADDLYTTTIVDGCGDAYYYTAVLQPNTYTCSSGYYLPAGAISCVACPNNHTCNGGTFTFNANETQGLSAGDILVTDAIGSCSNDFNQSFSAVFIPNQYTCSAGTYLAADAIECTTCPANSYCPGGTFYFNETTPQGATPCPDNQTSLAGSSSVDQCKTFTLNYYIENESYTTTTCTINGTVELPTPPSREGYDFVGWKIIQPNNE